ncbi:hypothetical protein CYMTET_10223 [Cymbomonas tetramitiformis]|uniref:AAA+ ATPase domain-containing protein n=1 Tax=Cymbomonas tetramitiformis TaxID=36881 RepID=A0AAE0LEP3_9CHLO|nr:hypothetical protein CYMTET_15798 [Cymbomonas tetramitiformis]KAK3282020.1 hypothetical protein CYMTET_10223 [Cymbomonas tetramitiformis]
MREMLRDCNPGLSRRFKLEGDGPFRFADYNDEQLTDIMVGMARQGGLHVAPELAKEAVRRVLAKQRAKPNFGNAGAVKNLLDSAKERMMARREQGEDVPKDPEGRWMPSRADFFDELVEGSALASLRDLVNAEHIIECVNRVQQSIKVQQARGGSDKDLRMRMLKNWVFSGPPGTGKTTVARAFGEVYHQLGLLADPGVVECKAQDLIGQFVGSTAPLVNAKMEAARGGVLFIDEAYGLDPRRSSYGSDAVEKLLANLTDPKFEGNMIVILAGYDEHMRTLLQANPGLPRRFSERLEFPSWKPTECIPLVRKLCGDQGLDLPPELEEPLVQGFTKLSELEAWGSAGDVCTVQLKLMELREQRCDDYGCVEGPLLLSDVYAAFRDILHQRSPSSLGGPNVVDSALSSKAATVPPQTATQQAPSQPMQSFGTGQAHSPGETAGVSEVAADVIVTQQGEAMESKDISVADSCPQLAFTRQSYCLEISAGFAHGEPSEECKADAVAEEETQIQPAAHEQHCEADIPPTTAEPCDERDTSDDDLLFAALDSACRELNYSLMRIQQIVSTRDLPQELLESVARNLASTTEKVRPMLGMQCPAVQTRVEQAIQEQLREQELQREAELKIRQAAEAEKQRLQTLEEERRRKQLGMFICAVCGRQGCPVRPVWHQWDEDKIAPPTTGIYNGYPAGQQMNQ